MYLEREDGGLEQQTRTGTVSTNASLIPVSQNKVLSATFVDVGQGDACAIRTFLRQALYLTNGPSKKRPDLVQLGANLSLTHQGWKSLFPKSWLT